MKTKKLKCIVTGKVLFATRDYYERKLKTTDGDENKLINSYVCKEVKKLFRQGYTVDTIREMLNITDPDLPVVNPEVINDIISEHKPYMRIGTNDQVPGLINSMVPRTDPDVKKFIETILSR
jgi:hypothetical protein